MPWRRSPTAATFRALAQAVDYKAGYVPGHSDGVAYLIGMMSREAGYDTFTTGRLELAALIHDVGKLRIPDSILLAERKLTEEEFTLIKHHSVWSANVAAAFDEMEDIIPWVRHHHERWDGGGYPDGLKGEDIPWPSRMILVADAFHVMTTDRPYQRSRTRREALEILQANTYTQFCPTASSLLQSRGKWIPADPPLSKPPRFEG